MGRSFGIHLLGITTILLVVAAISSFHPPQSLSASASSTPGYATPGAFAKYSALGGFIPFSGGVNGTVLFLVKSVYPNGSMVVAVEANVSNGQSFSPFSGLDSIQNPRIFPAVPPSNLTQKVIVGGDVYSRVGASPVSVPAGTFNTVEYSGTTNGTQGYYWFDANSGVAVEESKSGGVLELQSSNIALPVSVPNAFETSLPFFALFLVAGVLSILSFYFVRKGYTKPRRSDNKPVGKLTKKVA